MEFNAARMRSFLTASFQAITFSNALTQNVTMVAKYKAVACIINRIMHGLASIKIFVMSATIRG